MTDVSESGFKEVTRVADARERLLAAVEPHGRTDRVPLHAADGRVLAEPVVAARDVPHYARAAMDGWAVRAEDTFGAGDRSPAVLREAADRVGPNEAVRVHTGSEVPEGADAVVMVEETERVPGTGTDSTSGEAASGTFGDDVEVFDAVARGENVAPAGEDVDEGQSLYEVGHRLRPSDLGLLKATGVRNVEVADQPTVGVIPTGEELVEHDPAPGEVVETNGLTVSHYVQRWGGRAEYRNVVTDDHAALRAAIERDLTKDVVVTTGGSSVGERDLIPEVVEELGEVLVHGVALKPGHPCALGVVRDTPVVMLPGYPVACIVNAVQFLRPLMKRLEGGPLPRHPTQRATLDRKIASEPGVRTFARVRLEEREARPEGGPRKGERAEPVSEHDGETVATPTRASGSGVLSSVALADGWVVVPEGLEGYDEGDEVGVEDWEYRP